MDMKLTRVFDKYPIFNSVLSLPVHIMMALTL